jgi:hypothetical protein
MLALFPYTGKAEKSIYPTQISKKISASTFGAEGIV